MKSEVKSYLGIPRLFINNEVVNTDSYITYLGNRSDYHDFTSIGFNIFSIPIYFSSRNINELTNFNYGYKGIFDSLQYLSIIDEEFAKLLSVNPKAYIFPRINLSLPKEFDDEHEEDLNDTSIGDAPRRISFSSSSYFNKVKENLKIVINYIQNKYKDNIIGYQLSDGMTQEWFPFDLNGSQSPASRKLFNELIKQGAYLNNDIDYHKFLSDIVANRIIDLSKYVKQLTNNQLVVGTFYGYSYALPTWKFVHGSLETILNSKYVDFICSPLGYWLDRSPFEDSPYMSPVASIKLHNKLYFQENDTRTDLSKLIFDNPAYRTPLWFGPNRELSINLCKMHYAKALCNGVNYWWFDMWGGWYKDDEYLSMFNRLKNISKESLNMDNTSMNEVAVITDEHAFNYLDNEEITFNICRNPLKEIGKSSMPIDFYIASDFDLIKDTYKCFIIMYPCKTSLLDEAIQYLKDNNKPYLIINKDNYDMTSSKYREFYISAGLTPRFNVDAVVYENKSFLYVHALKDETLEANFDYKLTPVSNEKTFPFKAKAGHGYLFYKNK